jgi:hypothetical protein
VQEMAVQQGGLPRSGQNLHRFNRLENPAPCGTIGFGQINCFRGAVPDGAAKGIAHDPVTARPDHQRCGIRLVQRQAQDEAMRLAQVAAAGSTLGQQPVHMRGVTVDPEPVVGVTL